MTRAATPPILLQLQNPDSLSTQAEALRSLKNETIGHEQRKEAWIRWGILPILAQVLSTRQSSPGKTAASELNGAASRDPPSPTTEADKACRQAIIILGSLAQGILLPSIHTYRFGFGRMNTGD